MANYLWINPVAAKMYGDKLDTIQERLKEKGYIMVGCEPQLEYVKAQYVELAKTADETILDCRCPESINLLEKHNLTQNFQVPGIEPILVRTARVLYETYIKEETDSLIITCPCTQLRDFTAMKLRDKTKLTSLTWKEFIEAEGMKSLGQIEASPIPLGFFDDVFERPLKLSSEEEILREIKKISTEEDLQFDIVEMLYCKDGCNNGNGI